MAQKIKTREVTIVDNEGTFNTLFRKFTGNEENQFDFDSLAAVRKLLSNEKAKILHTLRAKNPKSIYELAKLLNRDFKSVSDDVKLLERFGFIDMIVERTGKRERLRPVIAADAINLTIKF